MSAPFRARPVVAAMPDQARKTPTVPSCSGCVERSKSARRPVRSR
ncbi:hypothetical protein [Streptomyces anulatus]